MTRHNSEPVLSKPIASQTTTRPSSTLPTAFEQTAASLQILPTSSIQFFLPLPSLLTSRREIHDFPTRILPGDLQKLKIVRYLQSSKRRNKELIKARRETQESTQLAETERKEYYRKSKEQELTDEATLQRKNMCH